MSLTDIQCKNAKPKDKSFKIFDKHGLYLEITSSGSKLWRFRYRYNGKEKRISLGSYPMVSLSQAREEVHKCKTLLLNGDDPSNLRKEKKRQAIIDSSKTVKTVALEWHDVKKESWSPRHASDVLHRMETYIFPHLGNAAINKIEPPTLLQALRKIESTGAYEMANRIKSIYSQIFRFGIVTGKCERDPTPDLRGALKTRKVQHFHALSIEEIPEFLAILSQNKARLFARTQRAVLLSLYTFVRPGELRTARMDEMDLKDKRWIIPGEKMKMGKDHIVPLSNQAVEVIKEQRQESNVLDSPWLFPNHKRPQDPMSDGTVLMAIKRMGYNGRMTAHGFRALARTAIREKLFYDSEVIERQLAHTPNTALRGAYDRAQFIEQRIQMMQDWADYLNQIYK